MWKTSYSIPIFISLFVGTAHAVVSPTSVKVKVYEVWVSTSQYCTNMERVYSNTDPSYIDMVAGDNIGQFNVSNGTYPCIAIKMSDIIKYKPAANEGACSAGTEYTRDVCRAGSSGVNADDSVMNCTGSLGTAAENQITVFISTASSTSNDNDAFNKPTVGTNTNGFNLDGSFQVFGSQTNEFVVNFSNKIDGTASGGTECDCNPPEWGFR